MSSSMTAAELRKEYERLKKEYIKHPTEVVLDALCAAQIRFENQRRKEAQDRKRGRPAGS